MKLTSTVNERSKSTTPRMVKLKANNWIGLVTSWHGATVSFIIVHDPNQMEIGGNRTCVVSDVESFYGTVEIKSEP